MSVRCLAVMPDEQGRYHFDEMGNDNLPEYLGGPLAPDEAEHYRNQQAQQEYLCKAWPHSMTRGRNTSRPSLKTIR